MGFTVVTRLGVVIGKRVSPDDRLDFLHGQFCRIKLNSYHSVATAQRMLAKLEKYSVLLIKLQEQAIALREDLRTQ